MPHTPDASFFNDISYSIITQFDQNNDTLLNFDSEAFSDYNDPPVQK